MMNACGTANPAVFDPAGFFFCLHNITPGSNIILNHSEEPPPSKNLLRKKTASSASRAYAFFMHSGATMAAKIMLKYITKHCGNASINMIVIYMLSCPGGKYKVSCFSAENGVGHRYGGGGKQRGLQHALPQQTFFFGVPLEKHFAA